MIEDSPMGVVADIVIVIAVMFIFPIIWAAQKGDYLAQKGAETITYEFCTNVCSRGYIDDTLYREFTDALSSTGGVYKITLVHKQIIYEPEYESGVFTGNVMTYNDETYTEAILSRIYGGGSGAYLMNKGDVFEVTIELATDGLAQDLTKAAVGTSTTGFYRSSQAVTGIARDIYERYVS